MESLNNATIYDDLLNATTYDFRLDNNSEISFNSVGCSPEPITVNGLTGLAKFNEAYAGVHGYLSVVVCLFGMVANSVNIVVLTRKNMLSSTNVLLTWLAVADLFTMLSYFPFALHFFIFKDPDLYYFTTRYFGWICFLLFHASFSIVCHTVAIWITIALAIFRFLYIWFPTRGATYCSLARAKLAITATIVSTIICLVPNYIINVNETMEYCNPHTNQSETIHTIVYRSMKQKEFQILENVNYWVQAIFVKLIPCIMLTILTVLLIVAMHRAYKKRMALKNQGKKDESDKHNEHNRTTLMLFTVVVLFLITEFPQGVLTLMSSLNKEYHQQIYENLGNLLDMMALLNNSINFVLYCTMSRQFRHTFISIFCKCCPENRPGWRKMGVVSSEKNGFATVTTHV
ncbi:G-protein coupled receptor dmsr-1-like [Crassostrea virginica]|uniref:Sex peptide receptor-like n=1 Tax=Crassostrea virginica TaxID=6565 RepID=A0A8B8AEY5_CRAVI|nr:sex peptide receptor-like [Crassostrea virginica]XP_022289074.1 sex peptide receptor-like [Crassostrea virginica]XP_022289075.1 sex peptide receptor-like [Crassostrea virginica]XP_022289076.1 sex peptide receptor-like [Crassostrea virginica]XP_022289077.1 sex peptide receptor-like [Crassostrea virginica]